jgi:hypothetical protein
MNQENANTHDEAIEALIVASLRAPDKEADLTDEEIRRYVDQRVTLSSEDEAALESSKVDVMREIAGILQGSEADKADCAISKPTAMSSKPSTPAKRSLPPEEFIEAVVIAQLTRLLSSPEYPLGRKRYQKLAYLSHRKAEDDVTQHFLKKAAGPYSPWARYQGPEKIALTNGYVRPAKVGVFEGLVVGANIDQIDAYLPRYPVCAAIDWAVGRFRKRKNDDLELLATVDFAALDLNQARTIVTVEAVKQIIATNKEWTAKLKREIFSDFNIVRALDELQALFPATYAR